MIKFFRHIRKSLIQKHQMGKYFKYAIGEIVLVMIGILLALQINNWNENRKDSIEEQKILKSLYQNLQSAESQSKTLIKEEIALKRLLVNILDLETSNDKIKITDSIFNEAVWNLQSDIPIFNAYTNLKSTNKLGLIKSKEINDKFTELEFVLNKLIALLDDRLSVHQIRIDNILEKEINFLKLLKSTMPEIDLTNELSNDYEKVLTNKRIRNLLGMKLTFTQDVINKRKELDDEIKSLIVLIEKEIKE